MPANPADIALLRQITQSMGRSAKTLAAFRQRYSNIARDVEKKVNAAGFMEQIIEDRFAREAVTSTGRKWKEREPDPKDDGHQILTDWGHLRQTAKLAVIGTFKLIKESIRFTSRMHRVIDYGKYHQYGTTKMVARPFFNKPTIVELKPAWAYANKVFKAEVARWLGIRGRR